MKISPKRIGVEGIAFWIVSLALVAVVAILIPQARPTVMFDEYIYSSSSFYSPDLIPTGGFLYSHIAGLVSTCGPEHFYDCGRFVNLAFLIIQAVGLFLIARLFLDAAKARWIALGISLFPMSIWTYLFMPEAMHISMSVIVFYLLLLARLKDRPYAWLASAAVMMGFAASVKVHSLFVLPATVLIIVLITSRHEAKIPIRVLASAGFVALVFATKLAVGYLVAGAKGLTLLGEYQGALDNFLGVTAGEEARPAAAPMGGFYYGFEDRQVDPPTYGWDDWPWLLGNQVQILVPIVLIAFGWIFLSRLSFVPDNALPADRRLEINDTFLYAFLLFLNALALSAVFNVFATLLGDDHTSRALFRYMEFSLPILSLAAFVLVLNGDPRASTSLTYRLRPWLLGVTVVLIFFGGQSEIGPGYADSSFVPLMGAAFVWVPIILVGLGVGYIAWYSPRIRKAFAPSIIAIYAVVGVMSHYFYLQASAVDSLKGYEVGQYLKTKGQSDLEDVLILSQTTPSVGIAVTEAFLSSFQYGLVLGNNPVSFPDAKPGIEEFVGIGTILYKLDDDYIWISGEAGAYEVFSRSESSVMVETLPLDKFDAQGDFEYFGNRALYSADGLVELVFDEPISQGDSLELCLLLPNDLADGVVEVSIGDSTAVIELATGVETENQCFTFGFSQDFEFSQLTIEGESFTNELEDGTLLSEVSFGVSRVDLTRG